MQALVRTVGSEYGSLIEDGPGDQPVDPTYVSSWTAHAE
jgi:hypothetical protein